MLAATVLLLLAADDKAIRAAVTFHASFDEEVKGDRGGGSLLPFTRWTAEKPKEPFAFKDGIDKKLFRIAKGKGVAGGALEAVGVLPRNSRIGFPAKGNLAFKKGGWSGSVSVWCKTDPDKKLVTGFCDPVQITQRGANDGGLWFDFNDKKPRDLRHGAFPALAKGEKGVSEDDPAAPMVRVPGIGWKEGDWHHVVLTWKNLDTGKKDAVTALWIDGKLIGEVKDRAIAMDWDVEKTNIYVAINYIGLLDELALFDRALTAEEIKRLKEEPGLLSAK
ncbi:MAG: LamG domain-containing protein [Gemmataceae bacterium]|nr:LamG domain-containing protein [Gemmataceae bacterium]